MDQLGSHPDIQWHDFIVSGPAIFQGAPLFLKSSEEKCDSKLSRLSQLPAVTEPPAQHHDISQIISHLSVLLLATTKVAKLLLLYPIFLPVELKTLLPCGYLSPARHPPRVLHLPSQLL